MSMRSNSVGGSSGTNGAPRSADGTSRRPVQHTVRVRDSIQGLPHSAGAVRPQQRLVPGLSAASRSRIQQEAKERRQAQAQSRQEPSVNTDSTQTLFQQLMRQQNIEPGDSPAPSTASTPKLRQHSQRNSGSLLNIGSGDGGSTRPAFEEELVEGDEAGHHDDTASVTSSVPGSRMGFGGGPRSVASSAGIRSVGGASVVSALSIKSLSSIEQQLGTQLPLTADGSKVVLTQKDVSKIKDTETLKFLAEFGSMFIQKSRGERSASATGGEVTPTPSSSSDLPVNESNQSPKKKGVDASQLAETMDELQREITTFITATDHSGMEYAIPTDAETGGLEVPLDTISAVGEGPDGTKDGTLLNDIADLEQDLAEYMHIIGDDSNGGTGVAMAGNAGCNDEEDPDPESEFQAKLNEVLSPEAEMQMLLGPDGTGAPTGTSPPPPEDDDGTANDGIPEEIEGEGKETLLSKVPTPPKPANPSALKFSSTWASKPTKRQKGQNEDSSDASIAPGPSVPSTSSKKRQSLPTRGPTKALDKNAFYKLDKFEEERLEWLLATDDWENAVMDADEDLTKNPFLVTDENDGTQSVTTSTKSSKTSTSSSLGYDRASAASYRAGGAYGMDSATEKRLIDIDAQLEKLAELRANVPNNGGVPTITAAALLPDSPSKSRGPPSSNTSSPTVTPIKPKKGGPAPNQRSPAGGKTQTSQQKTLPPPVPTEAEQRMLDAKKKGNVAVQEMREDRIRRQQLGAVNDRLKDISAQLDLLSIPPFSLEMQYDLHQDPADMKWPEEIQPPSENAIQDLINQARLENQLALQ